MNKKGDEERKEKIAERITAGLPGERSTVTGYGAYMLQGITRFLYENPAEACKEYVSNAADVKKRASVRISCVPPEYDTMVIADDGPGMDKGDLKTALDIYVSSKRRKWNKAHPQIGHFGVGIYAGALLCEFIHIKTKTATSSVVNHVTLPVKRWLEESATGYDLVLQDVLHYTIESFEAPQGMENSSFTIVTLENILERYRNRFKREGFGPFSKELAQLVPIAFPPNLKLKRSDAKLKGDDKWDYEEDDWEFQEWLDEILGKRHPQQLHYQFNNVSLLINGDPVFRLHPDDPVSKIHHFQEDFVVTIGKREEVAGVGWAIARGPTKGPKAKKPQLSGVFKDPLFQGIQVRLLNVPIYKGDEIYNIVGITTADMPYKNIWGEIYLCHETLQATLPRRGIGDCAEWEEVKGQIRKWLNRILKQVEEARRPPERKRRKKLKAPAPSAAEAKPATLPSAAGATPSGGHEAGTVASGVKQEGDSASRDLNQTIDFWLDSAQVKYKLSQREKSIIRVLLETIVHLGGTSTVLDEGLRRIEAALEDPSSGTGGSTG